MQAVGGRILDASLELSMYRFGGWVQLRCSVRSLGFLSGHSPPVVVCHPKGCKCLINLIIYFPIQTHSITILDPLTLLLQDRFSAFYERQGLPSFVLTLFTAADSHRQQAQAQAPPKKCPKHFLSRTGTSRIRSTQMLRPQPTVYVEFRLCV